MMRRSCLLAVLVLVGAPACAQERQARTWTEEKCVRYQAAWRTLLERRGRQGLSQAFLESHERFLASGCTAKPEVCPQSSAELDVANILVVAAMNAGTASTFLPFACRR